MATHSEITCPKCGQQLRIPNHIGGMLMACPSCGQKFHSDFKLAGAGKAARVRPAAPTSLWAWLKDLL